jgi:hypothetical protein
LRAAAQQEAAALPKPGHKVRRKPC